MEELQLAGVTLEASGVMVDDAVAGAGPAGAAGALLDAAAFDALPEGLPRGFSPPTSDLLAGLPSSEDTSPMPSALQELAPEEQQQRKRRRERWEREQEERRKWELQRRLAAISTDVELLAREVARIRAEVHAPLPDLQALPERERLALDAARAKRLADLVTNQCKKALQHITSHKWSWPFNHPVDTKVYKDYLEVVEHPIDFTTITRRINSGYYKHPDTFLADVRLVFTNARAYNKPGSDVFVMANTLQERFEERFTTSVLPRLVEEAELSRKELEAARRRAIEAHVRPGGEALEAHLAMLVRYVDEVSQCITDAKGAAAALCTPVSRQERQVLCQDLGALRQEHFEMAVGVVLAHHPGLQPYDDIGFDLDALDALTLRQLRSFVKACQQAGEQQAARNNSSAAGGSRAPMPVPWPALPVGAGARGLPAKKRPRPQQQQQQQQQQQLKQEDDAAAEVASPGPAPGVQAPVATSAAAPKPLGPASAPSAGRSAAAAASPSAAKQQPAGLLRGRPHKAGQKQAAPRSGKASAAVQMLKYQQQQHQQQRQQSSPASNPGAAATVTGKKVAALQMQLGADGSKQPAAGKN